MDIGIGGGDHGGLGLLTAAWIDELASGVISLCRFSPDEADELRLAVHLPEFRDRCVGCKGDGPGCAEDAPYVLYEITGKPYRRCPFRLVRAETSEWIGFYNDYKAGFLPVSGGMLDQAAKFREAMQIIEGEVASSMREKAKAGRG